MSTADFDTLRCLLRSQAKNCVDDAFLLGWFIASIEHNYTPEQFKLKDFVRLITDEFHTIKVVK